MERPVSWHRLPATLVFLLVFASGLLAQNATLTVQGVLKKSDGTTVPDGASYTLTFKLWDAETGGTVAWQETKTNVSIIGGLYEVVLGDGATVLNAPFDKPYFLGISLGTGSGEEFIPRPRLASAPYALSLLGSTNIFPSSGNVGLGTTTPNAGALLEVSSTSKGILAPRMTKAQRDAIASPATGLMLFQTDNTPGFYYFSGSTWKSINEFFGSTGLKVGDFYRGGIIFYLEPSGANGLIVSPSVNASFDAVLSKWGCSGVSVIPARGTALGSGQANTTSIIRNSCAAIGGGGVADIAAERADEILINNYSDWYLPSKDELELMHKNLHVAGLGSFSAGASYWSSTENDVTTAWLMVFDGNAATIPSTAAKTSDARTRFVRAF
jgi:hypothetical protein